ncbi:hypothetical protein MYX65_00395 [Acidobacteria bacterium AH-259-L09]|nr:hypothetical protein [Acidobacteria bacterium AH-259-L09]
MPEKLTLEYFRDRGLLPYQAQFAVDFLKPDGPPNWELVAPVGAGKTHLGSAIVTYVISVETFERVLLLSPATLLSHWAYKIESLSPQIKPLIVTRKEFLDLEARAPMGEPPWPEKAVILMSMDLAKREDMAENLSGVEWDLLVVDESHLLRRKRRAVFDRLTESGRIRRVLLLSSLPFPSMQGLQRRAVNLRDVLDWEGNKLFQARERKLAFLMYERATEERVFLGDLSAFARSLADKPTARLLMRFASSSIYNTETSLRRLRDAWKPIRNKLAHGMPLSSEDLKEVYRRLGKVTDEIDVSEEMSDDSVVEIPDFLALFSTLESLLEQIDEVTADSKLEVLISYLKERFNTTEAPHLCIWSSFVSTAQYLSSSLEGIGVRVYVMTGSLDESERNNRIEAFRDLGELLVTTDVELEGVTLEYVDECINYDLPSDPVTFEQRWGRFDRFGGTSEFKMLVLRDKAKTLAWEEEILEKIRRHGGVAIEE